MGVIQHHLLRSFSVNPSGGGREREGAHKARVFSSIKPFQPSLFWLVKQEPTLLKNLSDAVLPTNIRLGLSKRKHYLITTFIIYVHKKFYYIGPLITHCCAPKSNSHVQQTSLKSLTILRHWQALLGRSTICKQGYSMRGVQPNFIF